MALEYKDYDTVKRNLIKVTDDELYYEWDVLSQYLQDQKYVDEYDELLLDEDTYPEIRNMYADFANHFTLYEFVYNYCDMLYNFYYKQKINKKGKWVNVKDVIEPDDFYAIIYLVDTKYDKERFWYFKALFKSFSYQFYTNKYLNYRDWYDIIDQEVTNVYTKFQSKYPFMSKYDTYHLVLMAIVYSDEDQVTKIQSGDTDDVEYLINEWDKIREELELENDIDMFYEYVIYLHEITYYKLFDWYSFINVCEYMDIMLYLAYYKNTSIGKIKSSIDDFLYQKHLYDRYNEYLTRCLYFLVPNDLLPDKIDTDYLYLIDPNYIYEYAVAGRYFFLTMCYFGSRQLTEDVSNAYIETDETGRIYVVNDMQQRDRESIITLLEYSIKHVFGTELKQIAYLIFNICYYDAYHYYLTDKEQNQWFRPFDIPDTKYYWTKYIYDVVSDYESQMNDSGEAVIKDIVPKENYYFGPLPVYQITSPTVRLLSNIFMKQNHTQWSCYTPWFRTNIQLQTVKYESPLWKWLHCQFLQNSSADIFKIKINFYSLLAKITNVVKNGKTNKFILNVINSNFYKEFQKVYSNLKKNGLTILLDSVYNPVIYILIGMYSDDGELTHAYIRENIEKIYNLLDNNTFGDTDYYIYNHADYACKNAYDICYLVENTGDPAYKHIDKMFEKLLEENKKYLFLYEYAMRGYLDQADQYRFLYKMTSDLNQDEMKYILFSTKEIINV